jgi:hypothetical protein
MQVLVDNVHEFSHCTPNELFAWLVLDAAVAIANIEPTREREKLKIIREITAHLREVRVTDIPMYRMKSIITALEQESRQRLSPIPNLINYLDQIDHQTGSQYGKHARQLYERLAAVILDCEWSTQNAIARATPTATGHFSNGVEFIQIDFPHQHIDFNPEQS